MLGKKLLIQTMTEPCWRKSAYLIIVFVEFFYYYSVKCETCNNFGLQFVMHRIKANVYRVGG